MRAESTAESARAIGVTDRDFVVELTRPIARNSLYESFRALMAIDVQVRQTSLRLGLGVAVQTLHLAELDGSGLDVHRVQQVLAALKNA